MKNLIVCTFILCLTMFVSCGTEQIDKDQTQKQETPKALQDEILDVKSYSRSSNDLTEELYQELVEKSAGLKKLENDLEAFSKAENEPKEKFNKYNEKSLTYYHSANNKAETITDSLLRKKITDIIAANTNTYKSKTAGLNSLLEIISKNNTTLQDYHCALKILVTLPLIEKYQNENLPDKKEFRSLVKVQEKLLKQTDSLTPKH